MRLALSLGLAAFAVLFAFWRGGRPEKATAIVLVAMFIADRAAHPFLDHGTDGLAGAHFAIDASAFCALLVIMLRSRRLWPIWALAFQILSVASHLVQLLDSGIPLVIQKILGIAPSYGLSITLIIGTFCFHRRNRLARQRP